ncbi:MAG: flagellar FliJ family protein [Armatimonadetes bacterium]|nr:flagellar FliJ family protein [Armatimonadota bacterium]
MKKFSFRLQRVLDFRVKVEEAAQEGFLEARAARIAGESEIQRIKDSRKEVLFFPADTLAARKHLQERLEVIDEQERIQAIANETLAQEEEAARQQWLDRKQELETLVKLREKEVADWEAESNRHEQRTLDEWAVLKRAA